MLHVKFGGEDGICLENQHLRVIVIPGRGGKTASVRRKDSSFELLFQQCEDQYPTLYPGMPFSQGDSSGFDDVFPSMGEQIRLGGRILTMPDHGEIWTLPMDTVQEEGALIQTCQGRLLPYRYEKRIWLDEDSVRYEISICNTSKYAFPCVWLCHCLMNLEEGAVFALPWEGQLAQNILAGSPLGSVGQLHVHGGAYDFDHQPSPGLALKYYLSQPVRKGLCVVDYPRSGVRAELSFDPEEMPYLGFWITTGGYRGHNNFAFEPATGYYDTIGCSQERGRSTVLEPSQTLRMHLGIRLCNLSTAPHGL